MSIVDTARKREFEGMISLAQDVITNANKELADLRMEEDDLRERARVVDRKKVRPAYIPKTSY